MERINLMEGGILMYFPEYVTNVDLNSHVLRPNSHDP